MDSNTKIINGLGYCNKARNPNPKFEESRSYAPPPKFVTDLVEQARERDLLHSDVAMWARANSERKKAYYPDRVKSISELIVCFARHVNILTGQVQISLRNASDACGLTTTSKAELEKAKKDPLYTPKVSISRASRAFKDMVEDLCILNAPKDWQVWDEQRGQWIDKVFEVTPLFFKMLGISPERLEKVRQNRLKYLSKRAYLNLTESELLSLSSNELKALERHAYRKKVFARRKNAQALAKLKRQLHGKTREQQRAIAQSRVIKELSKDILCISDHVFTSMVNKELGFIREITGSPPED